MHATRVDYDVAGSSQAMLDFIPLIKAVQAHGASVQVWALSNGLSPALTIVADKFVDLDPFLLGPHPIS